MKITPRIAAVATVLALGAAGLAVGAAAGVAEARAQASSADRGETLFRQRCASCHTVSADARGGMGPNLAGVVGRRAAAQSGYNYSNGMKASGLSWTRENLDAYLAAPARTVRGTRMMTTVPNPADRAAIIDYLAQAR